MIYMSKLTKIVLINWMYFQKTTLNIAGNAAIVGTNGSGKSTIIDAIQLLLLGQKQAKFNSGANAEKRTLESYVRGHVNTDGKEYLRNGDVVTYLALEVEINKTKHVFGINIEYKSKLDRLSDNKYFYINNCSLKESLFVTEKNYPKTYDVFSKEMKREFEFVPFQTLMTYQNKIKDLFALKTENAYFKILSRAIGLKNITECDKFMNEFVLDENIIDVSGIKNSIIDMKKVNKMIELEEEKANALNEIVDKDEIIQKDEVKNKGLKLSIELFSKMLLEREVDGLTNDNSIRSNQISEQKNKKTQCELSKKELVSAKSECERLLDQISPDLPFKLKELNDLQDQYDATMINYNTIINACREERCNLERLKKFKNKIFDDFTIYLSNEDFSSIEMKTNFIEFRNEVKRINSQYKTERVLRNQYLAEYRTELENLTNVINKLKNNEPTFKKELLEFKNYLQSGLYDKYHEDIEIKFLCEYLDINDESWRNAIEGYLGAQRFHVILPNKYYHDALKLYHANSKFYGIRIVNGNKLPDYETKENTLSMFIEASNSTALNYARYILNRVYCAKGIYDLDSYDISITKDCMCYQNYSSWRINPNLYRDSFIGQEGLKRQLRAKQEEYALLNEEVNKLIYEYRDNEANINLLSQEEEFTTKILEDSYLISSIDREEQLKSKINDLKREIAFYKSNPQYLEIQERIIKIEKSVIEKNQIIDDIEQKVRDLYSDIKTNERLITEKCLEIDSYSEKLNEYDAGEIHQLQMNTHAENITKSLINRMINEQRTTERKLDAGKIEIEHNMREIRNKFSINIEPSYSQIAKFREEKNKINRELFKYNSKFIEMQKSHRKLFFNEFLTKLHKSIEDAKEIIKNLNSSLSTFTFGNDYYSIKTSITDNQDLKTIYEYAKKYNSDSSDRGLFVDRELEDRERQQVENLLNNYMFSEDINIQNIVVDYRKYLYFDVEVHTPDGIKSLNKVIRSQSGGEVQVPFYILSGVAFKQTLDYKRNKDALGVVLYDEAFDKMDSQRIQSMLQFYRDKLNLQIILATPGKLDSLTDNIETVLVVVREGEKAIVSDYTHEI